MNHSDPKSRARLYAIVALVALFAAMVTLGVAYGPAGWRAPWAVGDSLVSLRWPRVVLAVVIGVSLASAGVVTQSLLQNDLAEPYLLGISGGASATTVASLAMFPLFPPGLAACLGAAAAAWAVYKFAGNLLDPSRLLLSGFALSAMLASVTGLLLVLAPSDYLLRSAMSWLFGGLGVPMWTTVLAPSLACVVAFVWVHRNAENLDRLSLGMDVAASLGVQVTGFRRQAMVVTVLLTGVAVACAGLIGFVGLVAPHIARLAVGPVVRTMFPVAAITGAALVLGADMIARSAFAPKEVPVGLLTAALGGPLFLAQLNRSTS